MSYFGTWSLDACLPPMFCENVTRCAEAKVQPPFESQRKICYRGARRETDPFSSRGTGGCGAKSQRPRDEGAAG